MVVVYLDVTMLATGDDTLVLSPLADKAKYVDTSSAFLEFVPASVEFKVSDVFPVSLEEEDISDVVVSSGVVGLVLSSLTPLVESISRVVQMDGHVSSDTCHPECY